MTLPSSSPAPSPLKSPPPTLSTLSSSQQQPHPDLLTALPADVTALIIDQLCDADVARLPHVSRSWAALFAASSPLDPAFRSLLLRRFNLRLPPCPPRSAGAVYLSLRRERCHLCPRANVTPFAYAAAFALPPPPPLFPVCRPCFTSLLRTPTGGFVPVVEAAAASLLFPATPTTAPQIGFLYSDLPRHARKPEPISFLSARALAEACDPELQSSRCTHSEQSSAPPMSPPPSPPPPSSQVQSADMGRAAAAISPP